RVETETLKRSQSVVMLSDAALEGDLRALNVLSSSVYFETGNWAEFQPRIERALRANPQWTTLFVFDARTGEALVRAPDAGPGPSRISIPGTETLLSLSSTTQPIVGGVTREPEPVVHIYVPVVRENQTRYLLVAAIRTQSFQELLLSQVIGDVTGALVDRYGNFIARTRDYQRRVGTPATQHLRDAMHRSTRGIYQGTTYEGVRNYTAFQTSSWSGWSAHIAVPSALIDRPNSWSLFVASVASLGGLALGSILILLVLRDMSERRRADEALRQSQKMEAVGQLTGGIAHDFNNLLTAIIGNLDMIRSRASDNDKVQRLAENGLEAARRGAKLTSQLLAFSRSQRMQRVSVDLDALLNGMNTLLLQSLGPSISVLIDIAPDARFVMSDPNQLELALLNLAVNARDAMPQGGTFAISTQPAIDVDLRDLPRRAYVDIRARDTGTGMTELVRSRAIEPFFTTKQVGHGTGLGLSQVYGVARESGGTLLIESELGVGTTVRMILPAGTADAIHSAANRVGTNTPTIPAPAIEQRGAVLVIDDDRQVRRFIRESLRQQGYTVSDASNGEDGLALLRQQRFDLLVVDYAMPGLNGAEVARAAQALQSSLKILMVSGYADSAAIEALLGPIPLLRKPFDVSLLGATVAEVLKR
ncbi:MAG: response regulator, partial [Povalibacter sp.]